ncbi:uncharacterized protein N7459_008775 [Penicillium hispanicum]|uniref:uncharacterized protein n=1 Tax=Penicillium hispanicum TaxID=1080232 RepID=UPI00253FB127|nr:uncharacterized protein N7459_008775 [Penicillium hispanicum]KAJ5574348.1 hypothetical protein N7459_008775 [Penicillium hispanicum]
MAHAALQFDRRGRYAEAGWATSGSFHETFGPKEAREWPVPESGDPASSHPCEDDNHHAAMPGEWRVRGPEDCKGTQWPGSASRNHRSSNAGSNLQS